MPSDLKKKKAQAKKDAAKQRNQKKPTKVDDTTEETQTNGHANGIATGDSDRKDMTTPVTNGASGTDWSRDDEYEGSGDENEGETNVLARKLEHIDLTSAAVSEHRSVTGVLGSHPDARDIHIQALSITFHRHVILQDSKLELNNGRRYGLIGLNGCGKSTLLAAITNGELPIPKHFDVFLLQRELDPSEKTALEAVKDVDQERLRLENECEELAVKTDQESHERLLENYERLDELDADKAEMRAAAILDGLGFTAEMQYKKVKHFSGGWRMRIALARALFVRPSILLLDEPTNHLDLNACVWLEQELAQYKRILMIISHSQDFLNGVCTNIIHMHLKRLKVYRGNYDSFFQTRCEQDENQMKRYRWQQDQISHMKDYIARFGHGSKKLARQAQSKEKTLKKMVDGGLTEKVSTDKTLTFYFPDCDELPPPVIMIQHVSFQYSPDKPLIYKDLDFGIDLDTKVALVGPNGAGKSTLLKLIAGEIHPTDGLIRRHSHVRIGRYHQHLDEMLDVTKTSIDWMMEKFPQIKERDEMRKVLGRYGLTGAQQVCPIQALSDGQRCRIIFAWLAQSTPHMLLLDEPTNHLDIETIDSLAEAINEFNGGMMLVSHDFRLISQVTDEIWVCENQTVTRYEKGDIFKYKEELTAEVRKQAAKKSN